MSATTNDTPAKPSATKPPKAPKRPQGRPPLAETAADAAARRADHTTTVEV